MAFLCDLRAIAVADTPLNVADHAAEFDTGVVEHLVQPVDLGIVHMGEHAAVARDQTQLAQVLQWNEAGANQAETGQPLATRFGHPSLVAGLRGVEKELDFHGLVWELNASSLGAI